VPTYIATVCLLARLLSVAPSRHHVRTMPPSSPSRCCFATPRTSAPQYSQLQDSKRSVPTQILRRTVLRLVSYARVRCSTPRSLPPSRGPRPRPRRFLRPKARPTHQPKEQLRQQPKRRRDAPHAVQLGPRSAVRAPPHVVPPDRFAISGGVTVLQPTASTTALRMTSQSHGLANKRDSTSLDLDRLVLPVPGSFTSSGQIFQFRVVLSVFGCFACSEWFCLFCVILPILDWFACNKLNAC